MKMRRKVARRSNRCGTTLVESVVSLAVLAVCIGGACQLGLTAKSLGDDARAHYLAINMAKNRIERAKALEYDVVDQFVEDRIRITTSGVPDTKGSFRRSTRVTALGPNLRQVTVTVEILDRITLQFGGAKEEIVSCLARMRTSV
jgi:hypothetical protein